MKKYALLISILILNGFIFSQSITVTSPVAGDRWEKGSTNNITWTSRACTDTRIKINIFRDRVDTSTFVEQITCTDTGRQSWRIPLSYASGNYIIRVKTEDNECRGDSGLFEIYADPVIRETPEIEITAPDSSSDWNRGTLKRITWTKTGEMNNRVKIHLMNSAGTVEVRTISSTTPNDLNHLWLVPSTQAVGSYRIRVKTLDNNVSDLSPAFDIVRTPSLALQQNTVLGTRASLPGTGQPVIRVVYPNGGENISRGSRVEIRWECVDGFNPPKIKIRKNGRTVKTYGPDRLYPVPSRDGYIWPWIVPSDLTPGSDYKVRIEKGDFSRSNDESDNNFTITSDLNLLVTEPRGSGLIATNGTFIRWRAGGVEGNVNVHLQAAEGRGGPLLIRSNVPATPSSFLWYVGDLRTSAGGRILSGNRYKVIVTAADGSASGESNSFQIMKPTLEVIAPNGGEKRPGDNLNIRWNNSPGFHGDVKIILQRQSGSTWFQYEVLFPSTHDKNVDWTIYSNRGATLDPIPTGTYYRIRIESVRCPIEVVAIGERFYLR
ncbi:MAG: hypothetical protein ABFR36_06295 [Acidobacteriota bacterium]